MILFIKTRSKLTMLIGVVSFFLIFASCRKEKIVIWQIGISDNCCNEFALAPSGYESYIYNDFGWEDKYFLIGHSVDSIDWPYALPGISDTWGGTWPTSGWRSSTLNILFGLDNAPQSGTWNLVVDLFDCNEDDRPLFKVTVNGKSWKYNIPRGSGINSIEGDSISGKEHIINIPLPPGLIKKGGNQISLTTLQGSWLLFDQVRLEGPANAKLRNDGKAFLKSVKVANYEIEEKDKFYQPLLISTEHLYGSPELKIMLDDDEIFKTILETGSYVFEAPMPAVSQKMTSNYEVWIGGTKVEEGKVQRSPMMKYSLADYVDTKMGTAHSRWMIAPGPWMPFSMVKLSPDNQNTSWQAGYDPVFESVGGFSHIHEWTMSGLSMLPTNGELQVTVGDQMDPDSGYRSRLNMATEEAPIAYYKAELSDYNIIAELTSTTRCGFQRYSYPNNDNSRVLLDFKGQVEYPYQIKELKVEKLNDYTVQGFVKQLSPDTWSGGISQEYIVHFVAEFDKPVQSMGGWKNDKILKDIDGMDTGEIERAGLFLEFNTDSIQTIQVRTGISYVSVENAMENLETEISKPFGWNFEAVKKYNKETWNDLFSRVKIKSNDKQEKKRFYTNMYRALCSRNIFSDVDGSWFSADEKVQKFSDPGSVALGCDAFWNTFWNLNQFWNLVTPEWSGKWVKSQLAMYDANGWLAKGPAGMEYIPVMVAEHEIPLIVGAYQMGIRDFDAEKAFTAAKKMQTTPAQEVGGGFAGNRDLVHYLKHKYVPYDKGRFSNSLEYSYDDWTVGQFAKALGKKQDYEAFSKRGNYWRNAIDRETGYARLRKSDGSWFPNFDPFTSDANDGYVEGNAWQLTFFVPQNVPALIEMIGKERFVERLEWGFVESDKTRFNGLNDQYWDYPVVQGNQQSMHFAYLFNWAGKPWLTQKWSRAILDRYYGYGIANAYLGDEDQGQMSAWFIMTSIGLFQTDGGCRVDPIYEITSPLYERIEIDLGYRYGRGNKFIIEAKKVSRKNKYIQSAKLNGIELNDFKFPASELLKGGILQLEMGALPNKNWGNSIDSK